MVEIDHGLANSKFGIIILSETFFSKIWPINELSALFTINIIRKRNMLLPLLHAREYLIKFSPITASMLSHSSDEGVDKIAEEVYRIVMGKRYDQPIINDSFNSKSLPLIEERPKDQEQQQLEDISKEQITNLKDRITKPKTNEIKQTALIELLKLSQRTNLWKHTEVWDILNFLLFGMPYTDIREGLSILQTMLQISGREIESIVSQTKALYQSKLEEIVLSTQEELESHRFIAVDILKFLVSDDVFNIAWRSWEHGVREIKDDLSYDNFLKSILTPLYSARRAYKESVKNKLIQLMEDNEVKIRKRASDIYQLFFS